MQLDPRINRNWQSDSDTTLRTAVTALWLLGLPLLVTEQMLPLTFTQDLIPRHLPARTKPDTFITSLTPFAKISIYRSPRHAESSTAAPFASRFIAVYGAKSTASQGSEQQFRTSAATWTLLSPLRQTCSAPQPEFTLHRCPGRLTATSRLKAAARLEPLGFWWSCSAKQEI